MEMVEVVVVVVRKAGVGVGWVEERCCEGEEGD